MTDILSRVAALTGKNEQFQEIGRSFDFLGTDMPLGALEALNLVLEQ
jgi:hypothetical protein